MSYPPPPGLNKSKPAPHPSLPARPPASAPQLFKPAHNLSNNAGRGGFGGGFGGFAPRQVAAPQPSYNNYQQPAPTFQQPTYNAYPAPQQPEPAYGAAPQIRNPFAPPTAIAGPARGYEEDPEMAAQIAQWQSAYAGKDSGAASGGYTGPVKRYPAGEGSGAATSANAAPLGRADGPTMSSAAMTSAAHNDTGVASIVADAKTNQKTVVRTGGGKQWTDSSLLEWDPAHFRLFVGNLAGEVTDESLHKAFSRWPSLQKARVIREKRTTKSKAYGFVSFSDGDDFFQAAREMQGKYIGSHPVIVRRSTTEIKAVTPKDNRKGKNKGKGNNHDNKDKTGGGIQKPGSKTKGGLRVLG
jgi:hypothetical protein